MTPSASHRGRGARRRRESLPLRIEQSTVLEGEPRAEYSMTYWVDARGQVLKSSSDSWEERPPIGPPARPPRPPMAQGSWTTRSRRSSRSLKYSHAGVNPDIIHDVAMKEESPCSSSRRPPPGHRAGQGQDVGHAPCEDRGAERRTSGPRPGGREFLRPNSLVTSADQGSVADSPGGGRCRRPLGQGSPDRALGRDELKNKNFATAFAPASEVARNLSGDCTEHGVLTAALCRAVGVPARVAIGLVYVDHLGGFGFHMWNEVYVNRRWVAIDAAFDQSEVDAVHLKLSDTSLAGVSPTNFPARRPRDGQAHPRAAGNTLTTAGRRRGVIMVSPIYRGLVR